MKYNLQKISLFPKIYRFITEEWQVILGSFLSGIILIALFFQLIGLFDNLKEEKKWIGERSKTEEELKFWKSKLNDYKNYRDLYFKISVLEYKLGDKAEARSYLKKALEQDPNFEKAREMERQLSL